MLRRATVQAADGCPANPASLRPYACIFHHAHVWSAPLPTTNSWQRTLVLARGSCWPCAWQHVRAGTVHLRACHGTQRPTKVAKIRSSTCCWHSCVMAAHARGLLGCETLRPDHTPNRFLCIHKPRLGAKTERCEKYGYYTSHIHAISARSCILLLRKPCKGIWHVKDKNDKKQARSCRILRESS
jgi:hypothetical protein